MFRNGFHKFQERRRAAMWRIGESADVRDLLFCFEGIIILLRGNYLFFERSHILMLLRENYSRADVKELFIL